MGDLSVTKGEHSRYSGETLWAKFVRSAHHYSDSVASICTHQPSGHLSLPNADLEDESFRRNPYLRLKYKHFAEAVNSFTNALLARGVEPGMPVLSFVPNVVEHGISIWSTFKLGCNWVPINPRNLQNKHEVAHMIRTALSWKSPKSAVVIVDDEHLAAAFDELNIECQWMKFIVSPVKRDGWENFADVLRSAPKSHPQNPSFQEQVGKESRIILFTSGTTSLPKGVAHPTNFFAYCLEHMDASAKYLPSDVFCVAAPNNHAIGLMWFFAGHCIGASVVHPGPAFNPQAMKDTLIYESCTHLALVPTMVYALLSVKGGKPSSLKIITLGGSMASPEIVDKCLNGLGAQAVQNLWGMTEGCVTSTLGFPIHDFISDDNVAVGYPVAESMARVCAPNSKVSLPPGVPGELHYCGPFSGQGYIGKESDDFYDDDEGRRWFVTGDQAIINEKGHIFITGRYKEMIIRGGENISPVAIEATLTRDSELMPLMIQIVGAKDTIAGEVPVAVHKGKANPDIAQKIQKTVLGQIGSAHVPDQVIALEDLGVDDYPRTMGGKIRKNELTVLVQQYRDREQYATMNGDGKSPNGELASLVKKIWKRALGYEVDEHTSFASFADSITVMKTRDMIAKETGKQLSLEEVIEADSIAGQIRLLQQQPHGMQTRKAKKTRIGPITAKDVVVFRHQPATFSKAKTFIVETLSKHGVDWNDIADITPTYDFMSILNKTRYMSNWRITMGLLTKSKDFDTVRSALRKALANMPMLTSFLVQDRDAFSSESAFYITVKQTNEFLDKCIHNYGTVKTLDEVKTLSKWYPYSKATSRPGPLYDACLTFVEETQSVAIISRFNHAAIDASCGMLFNEDLDEALSGRPLYPHTDYTTWSDSYYSLRSSIDAQITTDWHANRLRGLHSHRKALWVTNRGSEAWEDRIHADFDVPGIVKLRHAHPSISAPVIFKTAFTLFNAYRSRHTHALYSNLQACRDRFPFIPQALHDAGHHFSATDVAGPTIEPTVNLTEIRPEQTVLSFLTSMQTTQDELTQHAAVPLGKLIEALGPKDGPIVLETWLNVVFNWAPGMGSRNPTQFENVENVATNGNAQAGFGVTAGLGGENGHTLFMWIFGVVLSRAEHWEVAKQLEWITSWLVDERNWGRRVGDYVECLQDRGEDGDVDGTSH